MKLYCSPFLPAHADGTPGQTLYPSERRARAEWLAGYSDACRS